MKKVLLTLSLTLLLGSLWAQEIDLMQVIPNDPQVRTGTLESGATYYIRSNAKDPQRANFHIVYKVGAIQEEDNQDGLAHFLEHMAFNESKNFPGNSLIDYLQSVGVRFGENLNAGTGQETTTYMITNVPVTRQGIVDSALLVLHDWAGFISLQESDIDEERGVIAEEWRLRNDAAGRLQKKTMPVLFNNSLYSKRDVIGDPEIIKNFKYDELRDFYHKWYRPDLLAFVIVGDFDAAQMEGRLREVMSDLKPFDERIPRAVITVADNDEPLVSVETDPELTSTNIEIVFRHKPMANQYNDRVVVFKNDLIHSLVSDMINQRLDEIAKKEGSPFINTFARYMGFVEPFDAFYVYTTARDGEAMDAFRAVYTELLRMQRGGFTSSELDRAKASKLRSAESAYENRNDRRNGQFIQSYMSNFTDNYPYPTPETRLELTGKLLDNITLSEINVTAAGLVREKNSAILISGPAKEGLSVPSKGELLAAMESVNDSQIDLYVDEVSDEPLVSKELSGSKVVSETAGAFGSTVWTLGNGVRVVLKATDFKADEIVLNAYQKGGLTTIDDIGELYSVGLYPMFENMAGVGDFTATQLGKMLTGKIVWVSPQFTEFTQGFGGGCSPKDFESLMQLTYLYYVEPRFEQADYNVLMNQINAVLPNMASNPEYIMRDSTINTLYGHNPRKAVLNQKMIERVSLDKMETAYRKLFSGANGMTFVLVGNFQAKIIRPLVEKYLGSLPSSGSPTDWNTANAPEYIDGINENIFSTKQENPKVSVVKAYSGEIDFSLEKSVAIDAVSHILDIRYTKSIREEAGGTYSVGVYMGAGLWPAPNYTCQISFDTDKNKIDELLPIVQKEIDDLMANGPSLGNLNIAKEFFIKKFRENNISNGTWSGYFRSLDLFGNDRYSQYEKAVNSLTVESVRDAAREAFSQKNITTVVQMPE